MAHACQAMPETLEAEVIEIDGKPPPPGSPPESRRLGGARSWAVRLDRRWWPLWVLLGGVLLVVGLTVGVVWGVLYVAYALVRAVLRLFFGAPGGR